MLSDLPSFRLPVPHLEQENMVRNTTCLIYEIPTTYKNVSMSHNSSISGIEEPVPAIRVINEKQMLLITVGINIMLSCGKEYVKLVWEFICKPGREN